MPSCAMMKPLAGSCRTSSPHSSKRFKQRERPFWIRSVMSARWNIERKVGKHLVSISTRLPFSFWGMSPQISRPQESHLIRRSIFVRFKSSLIQRVLPPKIRVENMPFLCARTVGTIKTIKMRFFKYSLPPRNSLEFESLMLLAQRSAYSKESSRQMS